MTKPVLISHSLNGTAETTYAKTKQWDAGQSKALVRSIWATNDGQPNPKKKVSDDKVVAGYSSEGLPFIIVVDGFHNDDTLATHTFIDKQVVPLMNDYALKLTKAKDDSVITKNLVEKIVQLRHAFAQFTAFTLSLATVYIKNNNYYVAGFGIGDTGIVVKDNKGAIKQLVANTVVDDFKDAIDSTTFPKNANIDLVLKRNTVFCSQIAENDEILGYTYVPDEFEEEVSQFKTKHINSRVSEPQIIEKKVLKFTSSPSQSLFEELSNSIDTVHNQQCKLASEHPLERHFGDDCALVSVIVPDKNQQENLIRISAIAIATRKYLDWMDINAKGHRFLNRFSHFFHGTSGRNRAQNILNMINNGCDYEQINKAMEQAIKASGHRQHSYSRYLWDEIDEHHKDSVVGNLTVSDNEFLATKSRMCL